MMTDRQFAENHIRRDWWTVTPFDGAKVDVLVTPPQTQREMMALYPNAGCIPVEHRGL